MKNIINKFSSFFGKKALNKIIFFLEKPKIVVLVADDQEIIKKSISQVLGSPLKVKKEILFVNDTEKVNLSNKRYLILNFDEGNVKKFKEKNLIQILTFGFKEGADFWATDLKQNGGTNFKVNYRGNIVPVWLKKRLEQKEIYPVLTAVAVGAAMNLNLVEISQSLKED